MFNHIFLEVTLINIIHKKHVALIGTENIKQNTVYLQETLFRERKYTVIIQLQEKILLYFHTCPPNIKIARPAI